MYKRYVCSLALLATLTQVTSCSKSSLVDGNSINPDVMSGVAATGAPISNGKVKIKGADGTTVEETTEADGSYSANVAELSEPYLVQVESPSGEKYISVASKSALAEGKKINVTPLTHTIVSNVFEKADPDDLFENFTVDASKFTEAKLEEQKEALFEKFVAAGLIGSGGVVDSSVDLLNGELLAGTSQGVDGLLDVLEVNTGAAAGIEIKLKGVSAPIITDDPAVPSEALPAPVSVANITAGKAQLTVLDKIRTTLNSFAQLHINKLNCNGAPQDNGGSCDVDTLESLFLPYFHADFQDEGHNKAEIVWDWFCVKEDDGWVTTRQDCMDNGEIFIEEIVLKDVTLINYNDTTKEALVAINIYIGGVLEGAEDFYMKLDTADGKFKLLGTKKTFRYWIETESVFESRFVKENPDVSQSESLDEKYSVNLSFWFNESAAHTFNGDEIFTLTAVSGNNIFPGNSDSMPLYLVPVANYDETMTCYEELVFTTSSQPYMTTFDNATGTWNHDSYQSICSTYANACECMENSGNGLNFDWDTQKLNLTSTQIAAMTKTEKISMSGGGLATPDEFIIKKPLVVNEFNAATYVPNIGVSAEQYCNNPTAPLSLSVGSGRLDHLSIWLNWSKSDYSFYGDGNDDVDFPDTARSATYTPLFAEMQSDDIVRFSHLYVSSDDEFNRRIVRLISCQL